MFNVYYLKSLRKLYGAIFKVSFYKLHRRKCYLKTRPNKCILKVDLTLKIDEKIHIQLLPRHLLNNQKISEHFEYAGMIFPS